MIETALIVGAGPGVSASLTRLFTKEGMRVDLAARTPDKLKALCEETGATAHTCDAADKASVDRLFSEIDLAYGTPDVVVYNPSYRVRGRFIELAPEEVKKAIDITAFGGFLIAQAAAKRMVPRGSGVILLTGASASIKGYPESAPFAMGKFALRGMAQSMARELAPKGIHVAHFIIDGAIRPPSMLHPSDKADSLLDPDAIAANYLHVLRQPKSAWTWEMELRPWVEKF